MALDITDESEIYNLDSLVSYFQGGVKQKMIGVLVQNMKNFHFIEMVSVLFPMMARKESVPF